MAVETDADLSSKLLGAILNPVKDDEEDKQKELKAKAAAEDQEDDLSESEQAILDDEKDDPETDEEQGDPDVEEGDDLEDEDSSEEDDEHYGDEEEEGADDSRDTLELVMVDGVEHRVTLEELKASYSGGKAVQQRLQEATEKRKVADHEAQQGYAARQQYANKLAELDQIIQSVTPPEPDWNALQADPEQYNLARMQWDDTLRKRQAIHHERTNTQKEIQDQQQTAMGKYLSKERERVMDAIPELANEEVAAELGHSWLGTLKDYGFTPEEFADVTDHRILRVIHDFTKAKKELNKRAQLKGRVVKRRRKVKTSVRPNSRTAHTRADDRQRRDEAVTKRARETGNIEDIAQTLLIKS